MTRRRAPTKGRTRIPGLRSRLEEAEATLDAIRSGAVDAVVVSGPGGERTLAIEGATHPYHTLLNAMSDGAALLDSGGTILFCNRRLGEMTSAPLEILRGSRFQQHVSTAERLTFQAFLGAAAGKNSAREFDVERADGSAMPVWIAVSTVPSGAGTGGEARIGADVLMLIVTDLTERKRAEAAHRGLMTRLISAEDEERRRIARELHDETGQSLTALLVGLRAIEHQPALDEARSIAQRLRGVAAQTVANVARLARGLHPSVLDDMGLNAAVRRHVSDYVKAFGITVDVRLDDIASHLLPPLAQTTIYRIVQESLTNVARHARARTVALELRHEGTMLELLVSDDGVGFDVDAVLSEASGLGLHGMRERVALLGGSVEIESRSGQGTVVRARIPAGLAPPRDPAASSGMSAPRRSRDRAPD